MVSRSSGGGVASRSSRGISPSSSGPIVYTILYWKSTHLQLCWTSKTDVLVSPTTALCWRRSSLRVLHGDHNFGLNNSTYAGGGGTTHRIFFTVSIFEETGTVSTRHKWLTDPYLCGRHPYASWVREDSFLEPETDYQVVRSWPLMAVFSRWCAMTQQQKRFETNTTILMYSYRDLYLTCRAVVCTSWVRASCCLYSLSANKLFVWTAGLRRTNNNLLAPRKYKHQIIWRLPCGKCLVARRLVVCFVQSMYTENLMPVRHACGFETYFTSPLYVVAPRVENATPTLHHIDSCFCC